MIKIDDELHDLLHRSVEKPEPIELTSAKIDLNAALKIGSETALVIDSDAALFELLSRKGSRRRPDPDRPGRFLWDDPAQTEPILLAAEQWQTIVDFLDVLTDPQIDEPESSGPPEDEATPLKLSQLIPLTDAQWQPIKDSLAAIGIKADQLTCTSIQDEPLLRDALPWIAAGARLTKQAPTPKQAAAELQNTLKIAAVLLERLGDPSNYNWRFPRLRQMVSRESQALAGLLPPLKGFIAKLEHRFKTLVALEAALGSHSSRNARKAHSDFCRELTRLWLGFNPNAGKFKRRHLQRFLFACSKPFFPEVTDPKIAAFVVTQGSQPMLTVMIAAFVDHHSQDQQTNT